MKLIIFPLVFLISLSILSIIGVGTAADFDSSGNLLNYIGTEEGWFDSTDHLVMFANGTAVDASEHGRLDFPVTASQGMWNNIPLYHNDSGSYNVYGITGERILPAEQTISFDMASTLGMIAIVAGGIILAGFVGTKVLNSSVGGGNDVSASAIIKGTLFLTIWAVFSVTAMGMLVMIPLIGGLFYFFLTVMYCLGVVNQIGSPE